MFYPDALIPRSTVKPQQSQVTECFFVCGLIEVVNFTPFSVTESGTGTLGGGHTKCSNWYSKWVAAAIYY